MTFGHFDLALFGPVIHWFIIYIIQSFLFLRSRPYLVFNVRGPFFTFPLPIPPVRVDLPVSGDYDINFYDPV